MQAYNLHIYTRTRSIHIIISFVIYALSSAPTQPGHAAMYTKKYTSPCTAPGMESTGKKQTRTLRPIFISKDRKTATHAHNAIQKRTIATTQRGNQVSSRHQRASRNHVHRTRDPETFIDKKRKTYMPKENEKLKNEKAKVKWDRHLTAFCTVQPVS